MFLKRLELAGFKSFANRTELEFVPGVTAVVGPNGSGKSNISDAIRWVLGEQSAKSLRGSKMEDIIFAGSDSRKPVNYCEVSLTLDNSDHALKIDYSEVTITRRVYRSGDSEYYINRQSCRLRDIIELFMDTGVGKEAYSIIGQGRIEEILSTKADDRRGIFEEAAGIVKYKARKKEAEKKLEETSANLVRITDIIAEISDQIDPLKEQAERAKIYLSLKEQLKQLEAGLYVHNIEVLHEVWNEAKATVRGYQEQHAVLSSQLSGLDAQLSGWRWKLNEQDEKLEECQLRLLHVSEETEKAEGRREVLRERKKNVRQNHQNTLEKIAGLEAKLQELGEQRNTEEVRFQQLQAERTACEADLKQQESLLAEVAKELETDVEQLKSDYIELLNQIASWKNDLRHGEQAIESAAKKRERLSGEWEKLSGRRMELEEHMAGLDRELQETARAIEQGLAAYRGLLAQVNGMQAMKEEVSAGLRRLEQRLNGLISRRDVLQEMQAAFTGFMQGVKEILKAREKGFPGIHGAIAELLTVPPEYETAIEVALGGALQHVVVENEAAGRQAISYLKEHRLGRATFLPLDVIRSRRVAAQDEAQLGRLGGIIGVASDLVSCDETYRRVNENLLGSVIVTETLEQANLASRRTGYRYRFVTLEGDVVNPGGSMTGGTVQQKSTNLLGRSRQVEELEQEISAALAQKEQWVHTLQEIEAELQAVQEQQEELRRQGEQWRIKEQEVKGRQNQAEAEARNLADRMKLVEQELHAFQEELQQHQQKREQLLLQLAKGEADERELKERIARIESHRHRLQNSKEEHAARITELKVKLAELRKQQEAVSSILQRIEAERAAVHREWEKAQSTLNSLVNELEGNLGDEELLEKTIVDLRREKEEVSARVVRLKRERAETGQEIERLEREVKANRRLLKELEERLHKEEVQAGRYDVELDNLLHKLQEEYALTYEMAREMFAPPEDPQAAADEVSRLKKEIQALGVVNIGAMEEYERQAERLAFLSAQSRDLEEARETLYQLIREMEEEMSRRFMETFEQIRIEFQKVFTHLFVGGRADLLLSDPDHPLTTGIDIVAQPPGKKLQNLALLSGGEKALTAIALLFAILHVKPVPFCVLDEVEAALDDANVYRFAEYLRKFSGQTQFICVTHRKGTMEGADVLYGVTMQEGGVSKLVSVKLEDKSLMTDSA